MYAVMCSGVASKSALSDVCSLCLLMLNLAQSLCFRMRSTLEASQACSIYLHSRKERWWFPVGNIGNPGINSFA